MRSYLSDVPVDQDLLARTSAVLQSRQSSKKKTKEIAQLLQGVSAVALRGARLKFTLCRDVRHSGPRRPQAACWATRACP